MKIRIMKISVSGIKNLAETITVDFSNQMANSTKQCLNVKGIFGVNGVGKTGFITAIDIYKNACINKNYLVQENTIEKLDKLINYKTKELMIEMVYYISFPSMNARILKHSITIKKEGKEYIIPNESISKLDTRSLNDSFRNVISFDRGKPNTGSYDKDMEEEYSKNRSFISILLDYYVVNRKNNLDSSRAIQMSFLVMVCVLNINVFLLL